MQVSLFSLEGGEVGGGWAAGKDSGGEGKGGRQEGWWKRAAGRGCVKG